MSLPPFDGNGYRKRVLAAIDARGGPEQSDPFELYDLPLDGSLSDADVAARMDVVWAFWQKQRDHPKYRGVVTAMLAIHRDIADDMRSADGRRFLAERTREERAGRDTARYADLDAALARLVARLGGIPEDKVPGLQGLAPTLSDAEFGARVRRHRLLPGAARRPVPSPAGAVAYAQVRAELAELGQLDGTPALASLYVLLGLPPLAAIPDVQLHRDQLAARNRERRPDRRRALVDNLLAAVTALLLDVSPAGYLDDLGRVVGERLQPRVRAAVLVEDELTALDYGHLLREALAAGLDRGRAVALLAALARAAGVAVPTGTAAATATATSPAGAAGGSAGSSPGPGAGPTWSGSEGGSPHGAAGGSSRPDAPPAPVPPRPSAAPPSWSGSEGGSPHGAAGGSSRPDVPPASAPPRPSAAPPPLTPQARWQAELSQARAALRDGRACAARARAERAQVLAGGMLPPIRAVRDEVDGVLAEATQRWRAALAAAAGRRYTEAVAGLQRLVAIARDLPGPTGQDAVVELGAASGALAEADADCAAAARLSGTAREQALLAVLQQVTDHADAQEALAGLGVAPARGVTVVRGHAGTTVRWTASPAAGAVDYRVLRVRADGASQVVGVTGGTEIEDGASDAAAYVVIARRGGVAAAEARSDQPDPPLPAAPEPSAPDAGNGAPSTGPRPPSAGAGAPVVAAADVVDVVASLRIVPLGRRLRLVYPVPVTGRAEVRRLADGVSAPAAGSLVVDPAALGALVPGMGPGLAVDRRPVQPQADYLALTVVPAGAVVGARATYVELPPVTDLRVEDGRLRWTWPPGCTEVMVLRRTDAAPEDHADPEAVVRKVTNTRYEIDGGVPIDGSPGRLAVFACHREAGRLLIATEAPSTARLLA